MTNVDISYFVLRFSQEKTRDAYLCFSMQRERKIIKFLSVINIKNIVFNFYNFVSFVLVLKKSKSSS